MNNELESRKMRSWTVGGLLLALGLAMPGVTWAQNLIRSISSNQQSSGEVIRVELSEPLASAPAGFAIQAPPRVAIDLPNVGKIIDEAHENTDLALDNATCALDRRPVVVVPGEHFDCVGYWRERRA